MLTRGILKEAAMRLIEYCENHKLPQTAVVKYKVLFHILDTPYDNSQLTKLRTEFLVSDIVEELYLEQDRFGGWGNFHSKDYSAKDKFPTSVVAINRCLYIGLTQNDRDILICASEYLEDLINGTARERFRNTNERVIPWNMASFCNMLEAVQAYNPLCDQTYNEWMYIAGRAFEDGEYSSEREHAAQHDVFHTREERLVPMQTNLLLKRRAEVPEKLQEAMLLHYGWHGYRYGDVWQETPDKLPENFIYNKTRRWFFTFNYINQFRGSAVYLADSVEWLMRNRNADGIWDWGSQIKDPWGYFHYFSTSKKYKHNRAVDCTIEVLSFLKAYLDRNE